MARCCPANSENDSTKRAAFNAPRSTGIDSDGANQAAVFFAPSCHCGRLGPACSLVERPKTESSTSLGTVRKADITCALGTIAASASASELEWTIATWLSSSFIGNEHGSRGLAG